MRFKILAAATLILLGIVVFSAYSGSNNESTQDDKDIIQEIEVNNSSFLDFSKDWNGFKAVVVDDDKFRKAAANESTEKHMSVADENNIFKEIKLDNSSIKAPESCSEFETVIVNSSEFIKLASNGTLNLSLIEEDYELKLHELRYHYYLWKISMDLKSTVSQVFLPRLHYSTSTEDGQFFHHISRQLKRSRMTMCKNLH